MTKANYQEQSETSAKYATQTRKDNNHKANIKHVKQKTPVFYFCFVIVANKWTTPTSIKNSFCVE